MYVYGKNVVNEILKNKKKIKKAFLYNDFSVGEKLYIKEAFPSKQAHSAKRSYRAQSGGSV